MWVGRRRAIDRNTSRVAHACRKHTRAQVYTAQTKLERGRACKLRAYLAWVGLIKDVTILNKKIVWLYYMRRMQANKRLDVARRACHLCMCIAKCARVMCELERCRMAVCRERERQCGLWWAQSQQSGIQLRPRANEMWYAQCLCKENKTKLYFQNKTKKNYIWNLDHLVRCELSTWNIGYEWRVVLSLVCCCSFHLLFLQLLSTCNTERVHKSSLRRSRLETESRMDWPSWSHGWQMRLVAYSAPSRPPLTGECSQISCHRIELFSG